MAENKLRRIVPSELTDKEFIHLMKHLYEFVVVDPITFKELPKRVQDLATDHDEAGVQNG